MKMTFRWFGSDADSVSLSQIRQIPGSPGIVGALFDIGVGEVWPEARIRSLKDQINQAGLELEVIESVNVHESIKLGAPDRDRCIDNYRTTIRHLARQGIKVICYNFMPVFDWFRTDLAFALADGSTALYYHAAEARDVSPQEVVRRIADSSKGFALPGWEPERLQELGKLFEAYGPIDADGLFANLKYFLQGVIPVCEEWDVKMAIHPDDPPWPIFGLPRIVTCQANLDRLLDLVDSPYNGLTLCSGSLGAGKDNDIPALIRRYARRGRIHFGHVRNIKFLENGDFHESSHLSADGNLDLYEIMKAYWDSDYTGYIRPDHGRMIWNEQARPGYGLYDRALGIAYLNGLWEAFAKGEARDGLKRREYGQFSTGR